MDDEPEFVSEEVIQVIKSCIESTLSNTVYNKEKLNGWCNRVVEGCIKGVLKMDKPFKYIVTCIIMQKNGAGLTTTATCFWDQMSDGACSVTLWRVPGRSVLQRTPRPGDCSACSLVSAVCSPGLAPRFFSFFLPVASLFVLFTAHVGFPLPVPRCLAGVCTIPWENDTMHAVITVYALALGPREIKASDLDGR